MIDELNLQWATVFTFEYLNWIKLDHCVSIATQPLNKGLIY